MKDLYHRIALRKSNFSMYRKLRESNETYGAECQISVVMTNGARAILTPEPKAKANKKNPRLCDPVSRNFIIHGWNQSNSLHFIPYKWYYTSHFSSTLYSVSHSHPWENWRLFRGVLNCDDLGGDIVSTNGYNDQLVIITSQFYAHRSTIIHHTKAHNFMVKSDAPMKHWTLRDSPSSMSRKCQKFNPLKIETRNPKKNLLLNTKSNNNNYW